MSFTRYGLRNKAPTGVALYGIPAIIMTFGQCGGTGNDGSHQARERAIDRV